MSKKQILESLERLKEEVGKLEADKTRIQALIRDLEAQLHASAAPDRAGMAAQIDDTVKALEVEHPAITGILNGIATTLSNWGI